MEQGKHVVLIVEDEHRMQAILADRFELDGFAVLTASDGKEGLSLALRYHPDIILLDIVMPRMDGISMTRELRNDPWGSSVPIVYLTNLSEPPPELISIYGKEPIDYLVKVNARLEDIIERVDARVTGQETRVLA